MTRQWTVGARIGAGFALTMFLALLIGLVGLIALRNAVTRKDAVIDGDMRQLIDAHRLALLIERKSSQSRGFLLSPEERFLDAVRQTRLEIAQTSDRIRTRDRRADAIGLLGSITRLEEEHQRALEQVFALRRTTTTMATVSEAFERQVLPVRERLDAGVSAFVAAEEQLVSTSATTATTIANNSSRLMVTIVIVLLVVGTGAAIMLTRALRQRIGSAVSQVQSSSAELQAAANQQATSAREQATAMSEISTTISELLVTSRQIADGARRVAQVAQDSAKAAAMGETTVGHGQESSAGIRRQTELIVTHMLDLGRKSQHIGTVLDIVAELAEQTNVLAINATIEAAGAGESGRRFAVVADEIRKLADRVSAATKEIRTLIDDVRSAVNATVMATETGAKTVEAGAKQFDHITTSLVQIVRLAGTTTEAGREIELSTKQQMTAVEQVNIAIGNIAQASKETETSATQTLQTASQLATLSKDLLRLVEPSAPA